MGLSKPPLPYFGPIYTAGLWYWSGGLREPHPQPVNRRTRKGLMESGGILIFYSLNEKFILPLQMVSDTPPDLHIILLDSVLDL